MKRKNFAIVALFLAVVLVLAAAIGGIAHHAKQPQQLEEVGEPIVSTEQIGDAQYRFTYERVGGTDEEPLYQLVIEVVGDEPLIIEGGSILGGH